MNHYTFEGVIKTIHPILTFKNNFRKREIVIVSKDEYPEEVKFEFTDENGINVLDQFMEGEEVKIAFLIKGNEYQGKHFVNLRGIAIAAIQEEKGVKVTKRKSNEVEHTITTSDDDDDLPF